MSLGCFLTTISSSSSSTIFFKWQIATRWSRQPRQESITHNAWLCDVCFHTEVSDLGHTDCLSGPQRLTSVWWRLQAALKMLKCQQLCTGYCPRSCVSHVCSDHDSAKSAAQFLQDEVLMLCLGLCVGQSERGAASTPPQKKRVIYYEAIKSNAACLHLINLYDIWCSAAVTEKRPARVQSGSESQRGSLLVVTFPINKTEISLLKPNQAKPQRLLLP